MGFCVSSQLVHQNFNHGICLPSSCQKSGWERKPEQLALQFLPTTAEFSPYEIRERSQRLALLEETQKSILKYRI